MTRSEYDLLQLRFKQKLKSKIYLNNKQSGAYENGVKACMSILSEIYHRSENDPSREEGYWILMSKSTFPQYEPDEYRCSRCLRTSHTPTLHYCPACGTKMMGVINKNDQT